MAEMTWKDRAQYRQELLATYEVAIDIEMERRKHDALSQDELFGS